MVERFNNPWGEQGFTWSDSGGAYVRYSDYAELEAENARLRREIDAAKSDAVHWSHEASRYAKRLDKARERETKALSRTGAVKAPPVKFYEVLQSYSKRYGDDLVDHFGELARILSAIEPAAPEGRQDAEAWQHIPNCGVDRESKMVRVTGNAFCDPCIAPLVEALNAAGIKTVASCCGHGHRPGCISLRDGRELFISKDYDEARKIDEVFTTDINGSARPTEQAVTAADVRRAGDILMQHGLNAPEQVVYRAARTVLEVFALKAAMEADHG